MKNWESIFNSYISLFSEKAYKNWQKIDKTYKGPCFDCSLSCQFCPLSKEQNCAEYFRKEHPDIQECYSAYVEKAIKILYHAWQSFAENGICGSVLSCEYCPLLGKPGDGRCSFINFDNEKKTNFLNEEI